MRADVVGDSIARAGRQYPCVRAFGEMAALLWAAEVRRLVQHVLQKAGA